VLGPEDVAEWLSEHATGGRVGLAASGTWGRGTGNLAGLALAAPDGANAYIDPTALTEDDERALAEWLADPAQPKAMHDAKGPMHAMAARGLELRGLTSDTALAAYLALPGQRSFDLADLAVRYVGRELTGGEATVGQLTLDTGGEAEWANALAQRARATADLADALDADLERRGAARLLADVELPLVGVLADMERAGIAADVDHLADMSATLGGEVKEAEQAAFAVTGHEFNLGSPKQLQEVLFTELGLPKTKRIKTGLHDRLRGAHRPAGADRAPGPGVPCCGNRDVARLKSIVDSLIQMAGVDGRIHTTYNQMIAATGRLSSTDPNLQNIPIRTEEGRRTRQAFIVGAGYETLLTADYSQIELRIMADLSGDQALADAFSSGQRFPRGDGLAGVRRAARGGHGRAAQQDQGDELRARLRPVLLRALAAAARQPGRGQRVHGRLLRAVRRHQGLPGEDRRAGTQGRLHRDDPRPPPLPAGPGVR